MKSSSRLLVHLSLLLTAAVWGGNFTATKHLLGTLRPTDVLLLRVGGAALFFALILIAMRGNRSRVAGRDLLRMFGLGILGITTVNLAFIHGQALVSAALASLIVTSNPIHTTVISRFLGGESLTRRKIGGIALAMIGFVIVLLYGSGSGAELSGGHVKGILLIAVAPFCWAFYTVLSKPLLTRYDPAELAAYTAIGGAVGLLPMLFYDPGVIGRLGGMEWEEWGVGLYLAALGFVLAYILWYRGLRVLTPSQTAVYIYLVPVFGLLCARLLLDERVTRYLLLGGAAILAGVILTNSGPRVRGRKTEGGGGNPDETDAVPAPPTAGEATTTRRLGARAGGR
jgi:drug/metabolite transporter (DMT)-like permease